MQRRVIVSPLVIQAILANVPKDGKVDPLPVIMLYSLSLAVVVGGIGAVLALLGV